MLFDCLCSKVIFLYLILENIMIENGRRVVLALNRYACGLGKLLLVIIILQLVAFAPPLIVKASLGITIVVNQTTSTTPADYYFDNLTEAFNFINGSSYDSIVIYIEPGEYNETFPGVYVLNNVTIISRGALINGNRSTVLHLVDSRNITFNNMTIYNFSNGIWLENSSMITFVNSNLTLMSIPLAAPQSLPTSLSRPTRTYRTPTLPRLKNKPTQTPASYTPMGEMILAINLGGSPAILVNNTSGVVIENTVLSSSFAGIIMVNSTNITIRNVTIYNMSAGGGIGGYDSNNITIDNVTIFNCSGTGIYLLSTTPTVFLTGIQITNAVLFNLYYGIEVVIQNGLIAHINGNNFKYDFIDVYGVNNKIENITGSDIKLEGIYVTANYSNITNIVLDNASIGIDLDFTIGNNVSNINITNSTNTAIYVSFSNNTLISNVIVENSTVGVYMEYAEDNVLSNATFKNTGDWGTIELDTCFNISISDILINVSTYDGLGLYNTNNTSVSRMVVIDALWPIYLWNSHNNTFNQINVTTVVGAYDSYGIEIEESMNNSFSNLRVYNITDADTGYLGVNYPVGIALFGNSSASFGFTNVYDIYDPATGLGVGVLVNNSSLGFIFSTAGNVSTGLLSVNYSSNIILFFASFSNNSIGMSLNESTDNVSLIFVVFQNTTLGLYSNNSNITGIYVFVVDSLMGIFLYNATNATLNNIAIVNTTTGVLVLNTNEWCGMNLTISDGTIVAQQYAIYIEDRSYASNITLDNITASSGGGIKISTEESHWTSPPHTNITISNITSENVTYIEGAGLFIWLNDTPVNLNITNITIGNSNAGLVLVGVGVKGGNISIIDVEIYNTTNYEAFLIENSTNITLRNMRLIHASNGGIEIGAYLGNVSNISLENISLENVNGTPIRIGNATNVTITHVYIENPAYLLDYRIKGNATILAVNTTLIPPPTGNYTPLGVYANVTLLDSGSWIQLTYTYPVSLGYPIVKWMYYNDTLGRWVGMPTTVITLNATHKLVITNHTGSTLIGIFGLPPAVGGELKLYTVDQQSLIPIIVAAVVMAAFTLVLTKVYRDKKK